MRFWFKRFKAFNPFNFARLASGIFLNRP